MLAVQCLAKRWILVTMFFTSAGALAQQGDAIAWVEYTGAGLSVRAIATGEMCPTAAIDGKPFPMVVRQASSAAFAVTSCQVAAPAHAQFAIVYGKKLKLAQRADRIVVIGDTGCRLKGAEVQDCNDPKNWPFQLVSQHAAQKHPDMVIHVGDYYYRETPCPPGRPGCQGSPHGDAWDSWRADLFEPAAASGLLDEAPWVFARGNHEQCGRGADGWFRFLDAGASPLTCPASAAPFLVDLPALKLAVIDTADIDDNKSSASRQAAYERQIPGFAAKPKSETWVVTHKPLWAHELTTAGSAAPAAKIAAGPGPADAESGVLGRMDGIDMIVSGHVHFFAVLDFSEPGKAERPAQLVVGDGGTKLDAADTRSGEQVIDGLMTKFTVKDSFGYLLLDREKDKWRATLYGADDSVLAICTHRERQLTCVPNSR